MTEAHEVVVNEDLEYIAQAERINDEGPRTIDLKPHAENRREIPVIKQEARKSLKGSKKDAQKSSKSFLGGALKNVRKPFKKPKKWEVFIPSFILWDISI